MSNRNTRYTTGPWEAVIRSTDLGIYGFIGPVSNRETIARVECPNAEGEANARLISAAPELLERCIQALEALNMLGGSDEIVALLDTSIKKAAGGAE